MATAKTGTPVAQVISMILTGALDGDEEQVVQAIKQRRKIRSRQMRGMFTKDTRVRYTGRGKIAGATGTVEPGGRDNVFVRIDDTPQNRALGTANARFTIPPAMLELLEEEDR